MIYSIANTKGGVGKTTLAINIAIARAISGREVLLVNGDRQTTADDAIANRAQAGIQPGIACSHFPEGPVLRAQVQQQKGKYDDVVIDVGGRDSSSLRAALVLTDVLIVPFLPRSFDVWAMEDIATLVDEARSVRDNLRAFAVMNMADPGSASSDNRDAAEAIALLPQFQYLPTAITRRKVYASAAGIGLSVLEARPRDPKALYEFLAFIGAIGIIAPQEDA